MCFTRDNNKQELRMKHVALIFSCLLALSAAGCAQSEGSILCDEARNRAIDAAQALLSCDSTNIMQLQDKLLNARSIRSEYLLIGDTAAADTFDIAFKQYVRHNGKNLADQIF